MAKNARVPLMSKIKDIQSQKYEIGLVDYSVP